MNTPEDETIEEKQEFLRNEIFFKGYDINEFLAFLISKKGENASDLDEWTLDELSAVVMLFRKTHSPSEKPEEEPEKAEEVKQENQSQTSSKDRCFSPVKQVEPEYVACFKSEKTPFTDAHLATTVSECCTNQSRDNERLVLRSLLHFLLNSRHSYTLHSEASLQRL